MTRRIWTMATILAYLMVSSHLVAQDARKAATSENNAFLERILKKFPDSDLDGDGVLTRDEATKFNRDRRAKQQGERDPNASPANRPTRGPKPTHADVRYGAHQKQAFDIWLAKHDDGSPAPLAIYIHGGGFRGGDKAQVRAPVQQFLDAGVSVASMNYRLTNEGPYPMQHHDAARGLQFIRSKAKAWNLDADRVACFGGSAGAGISLWLAFHDDLADPNSDDPVARQSTRIAAAAIMNGQCTYDLHEFRRIFKVPNLKIHDALYPFYAVKDEADLESDRVRKLMVDASALTHLDANDRAAVFAVYGSSGPARITEDTSPSVWVHHVLLGKKLKEEMNKLGLECNLAAGQRSAGDYKGLEDFLIKKLTAAK